MKRNATIYISTNESPYAKYNGELFVSNENFLISWKDENQEFGFKYENKEITLLSKGEISYDINLSNGQESKIFTPYGISTIKSRYTNFVNSVSENDSKFIVKITYYLIFNGEEEKYNIQIRGITL